MLIKRGIRKKSGRVLFFNENLGEMDTCYCCSVTPAVEHFFIIFSAQNGDAKNQRTGRGKSRVKF